MLSGKVAVVTPTVSGRNRFLLSCIEQVRHQVVYPFDSITHIVIADAAAGRARQIAEHSGCMFDEIPRSKNCGAAARARGVEIALSVGADWIWCVDDDVAILPDAVAKFGTAEPADVIIARLENWKAGMDTPEIIPLLDAPLSQKRVDTLAMFVGAEAARRVRWDDCPVRRGTDNWYFKQLRAAEVSIYWLDEVIGKHMGLHADIPTRANDNPIKQMKRIISQHNRDKYHESLLTVKHPDGREIFRRHYEFTITPAEAARWIAQHAPPSTSTSTSTTAGE